jgi:hypothetical protein
LVFEARRVAQRFQHFGDGLARDDQGDLADLGFALCAIEGGAQALAQILPAAAAHLGHARQLRLELTLHGVDPRAELAQDRADHALTLLQQGLQQVLGLDRLVLVAVGQRLRGLDRFLRLDRELVQSHRWPSRGP